MGKLTEFLIKAKKSTYASGNKAVRLDDGFEEFVFEEGEYKYRDRYHAKDPRPFGGEEVVWQNGKVIWIMNYYGFVLNGNVSNRKIYAFLRKAMSLVEENRPFRGPSRFKERDFEYTDESEGDVERFRGTEKIYFKGEEVYRLDYHGGKV